MALDTKKLRHLLIYNLYLVLTSIVESRLDKGQQVSHLVGNLGDKISTQASIMAHNLVQV